jgi:hypothetical protein
MTYAVSQWCGWISVIRPLRTTKHSVAENAMGLPLVGVRLFYSVARM